MWSLWGLLLVRLSSAGAEKNRFRARVLADSRQRPVVL